MGIYCNKCNKHIFYYALKPTSNTNVMFKRCNKCQTTYFCNKCETNLDKHYTNCKGDKEPKITFILPDNKQNVPRIDFILLPEELGGNVENVSKSFKMKYNDITSNCYEIKNGGM